jgi:hypothetical protein
VIQETSLLDSDIADFWEADRHRPTFATQSRFKADNVAPPAACPPTTLTEVGRSFLSDARRSRQSWRAGGRTVTINGAPITDEPSAASDFWQSELG